MAITYISTSTSVVGTNVTAAANTLTVVAAGATRISTFGYALANINTSDNCDVRVDGTLIGDSGGVRLLSNGTTDNHSLTVGQSGVVIGDSTYGAYVDGADGLILNYGEIGSNDGYGAYVDGPSSSLINYGAIYSTNDYGAFVSGTNCSLLNFGTITSNSDSLAAVRFFSLDTGKLENHGTISGKFYAILGSEDDDFVVNHGALIGRVNLGGGNDLFNGSGGSAASVDTGTGTDTLRGGASDDTLSGSFDNDRVIGNGGDDQLFGGSEADTLRGGDGDDFMNGGAGLDVLTGGAGADRFVWSSLAEMGTSLQSDRVTDFTSGEDQIDLDAIAGLTFVGNAAFSNVAGQMRYAKFTGQLQIDNNGDGVADAFLQLTPGNVLVADDLIF
jgi:Ca2+-binding RTX toxin-like protein